MLSPHEIHTQHLNACFSSRVVGSDGAFENRQNYDLSVSEAPKLFSDAEFEAVKRIEAGLKVLVLRKILQVNVYIADATVVLRTHRMHTPIVLK